MNRRDLISLVLGMILGAAAGVMYSWIINPLSYNETTPASLRQVYREEYFLLTALSFEKTGELSRAQERLASFVDVDISSELGRLAQLSLSEDRPVAEARALAQLAAALSGSSAPISTAVTATPTSPEAEYAERTPLPSSTAVPLATRTPTATPGAPFVLLSNETICQPDLTEPLLMVYVEDAFGDPVPGVEVRVLWDTGQDHFYTGLKPELGPGYGDFTMTPGVVYQVELVDGQYPVSSLETGVCTDDLDQSYPGSIELIFQQPSP